MTTPKWHELRHLAVDTETTGVSVHEDRIVTAAIVHLAPDHRPRTLSWLIDPGVDVPTAASDVHGWTTERLREELCGAEAVYTQNGHRSTMTKADALFALAGQVALAMNQGVPVIAFNASFDLSILEAECRRNSVPGLVERLAPKGIRGVIDPFVIDKHYSRRRGSRKLVDQVAHYGVVVAGAHDAGADALAAARLIPRMVTAYPELGRMSLAKLHQSQIGWRAEQMDSLRTYFDRSRVAHDGCCGEWPLHAACAQETAVAS